MTLALRAAAKLEDAASDTLLASGIAVIWADPTGWGGVFEAATGAERLRETVAAAPLVARLRLADGRVALVTLTLSAFDADAARPLTFRGQGEFDTAGFRAYSEPSGRIGL